MPRKTLFLIIALAVTSIFLIFLAVTSEKTLIKKELTKFNPVPQKKAVAKTTSLYFDPAALSATSASPSSVSVSFDTGNQEIAGIQVELSFDPKQITNVAIQTPPDSLFGPSPTVLFNEVNQVTGRISYAVAISSAQKQVVGKGKVLNISFQKAYTANLPKTEIKFIDKTMVSKIGEDESVLKETAPLNITLLNTYVPPLQTTTIPTQ